MGTSRAPVSSTVRIRCGSHRVKTFHQIATIKVVTTRIATECVRRHVLRAGKVAVVCELDRSDARSADDGLDIVAFVRIDRHNGVVRKGGHHRIGANLDEFHRVHHKAL